MKWSGEAEPIQHARAILAGREPLPSDQADIRTLIHALEGTRKFYLARDLLKRIRRTLPGDAGPQDSWYTWLAHQHARCTYRDLDLCLLARASDALRIMNSAFDLTTCDNPETLGIAGSIHKMLWQATTGQVHLEMAQELYLRGYESDTDQDLGRCGINAAFLCDVMACAHEAAKAVARARVNHFRDQAREIREDLVTRFSELADSEDAASRDWWLQGTLAEALFGLERFDESRERILRALALPDIPPWGRDATARQIVSLWHLRGHGDATLSSLRETGAASVIEALLGDSVAGVKEALLGRVGLGFSGGGFRAALYHIGTLAKLAECDLLHHLEVISCVSGGSIVGALYYLEVQGLLQQKLDRDITKQDYIDIVQRVQDAFMELMKKNVRMSTFKEFGVNVRMAFSETYSRTERAAEIFEEDLFSKVKGGFQRAPGRTGPIKLDELRISPKGEDETFDQRYDNWRRQNKVPSLVLNATSLNTGHNWQFTPYRMGEPPPRMSDVDCNYELCRMKFEEAPEPYQEFPLGRAVCASAAVPGLFEPVVLPDLYPGVTVRLADGGVHDNQGVYGLLEEDCSIILLSDASGQSESQNDPSGGVLVPVLRASDVLQQRIRLDVVEDLRVRVEARLAEGLMFIHLKKGLNEPPVHALGYESMYGQASFIGVSGVELTSYGIPADIQKALSAIRTDLDAFGEVESYGLMASAYRMTEEDGYLRKLLRDLKDVEDVRAFGLPWDFLAIEDAWAPTTPGRKELLQYYQVATMLPLKAWYLDAKLRFLGGLAAGVLAAHLAMIVIIIDYCDLAHGGWAGRITLLAMTLGAPLLIVGHNSRPGRLLIGAVTLFVAFLGSIFSRLHVAWIDPIYLDFGRLSRYTKTDSATAVAEEQPQPSR